MLRVEDNKLVMIQPKGIVVLEEFEIKEMLQQFPVTWTHALRRGKYYKRNESMMNRRG